jgi:DNA-binding NarL/FixJ family response regulator
MPAARPPLTILLIDDHALFREGVALLLQRLDARLHITEAAGCAQGLQWLAGHGAADLVLIDLHMPGMDGLAGLDRLREQWPQMPAVVMSADDAPATVRAALDHGAMGFIPKSSTADTMLGALRVVLAQGVYLPPASADLDAPAGPLAGSSGGSTPASLGLTPRQTDVLRLILQGKPSKLICRELGLSEGTVKTHTTAVLRTLNVTTRTQAVIVASRLGLRFDTPGQD